MNNPVLCALIVLRAFFVTPGQNTAPKERVHSVADINGRATLLVQPNISSDIAQKTDGNTLGVKVVVNEQGNAVSAKCSSTCPSEITGAAEAAAMASKFLPLTVDGRAAKYEGILLYTISMSKVDWFAFANALHSTYIFNNLSLGPASAMLTDEYAEERSKLQDLDRGVELAVRWKTIEEVKDSVKQRLKEKDAWWYDLGFGMREVTAAFQSNKRLDMNNVQSAISKLAKFADSAPAEIPASTIEKLRTFSSYKIDPAMSPREVSQAIFKLTSGIRP